MVGGGGLVGDGGMVTTGDGCGTTFSLGGEGNFTTRIDAGGAFGGATLGTEWALGLGAIIGTRGDGATLNGRIGGGAWITGWIIGDGA